MKKLFLIFVLFILSACNNVEEVLSINNVFFKYNTFISVQMDATLSQYDAIYDIYSKYDIACDYYTYSEGNLNDLNTNKDIECLPELIEVIEFALSVESVDDSFNILTGNINVLWKDFFKGISDVPNKDLISEEVLNISLSEIDIIDNVIKLVGDSSIDLGSIAKGYATKKVNDYLIDNNITTYLINAGGSNLLIGYKNVDESYGVGVKYPSNNDYAKVLYINNKSVVTSSVEYQSTSIDENFYSHIIDPSTGYSNNFYDSITLIGECSALLDCLSTAVFNMSLSEIENICELYNIDIVVIKDDSIIYETKGVIDYETNHS